MRLTVLGGCGAWPTADQGCSGYLVEHDGFRLLLDPGYATLPRLLELTGAHTVDAVAVTHGHPDHCADLNPLLRARAMGGHPAPPLPVHAPPGALDAVLALDRPGMLDEVYRLHEFRPGEGFTAGPFQVGTTALPHFVENAGMRATAAGRVLAYTGDTGYSSAIAELAAGADLLVCDATYVDQVPAEDAPHLLSAELAGTCAAEARVGALMLTHLWPGTDPATCRAAAARAYPGPVTVARSGLVTDL